MSKNIAIILAAGKGTRMNNGQPAPKPKVLYEIAGKSMLGYLIDNLEKAGLKKPLIVIGHQGQLIKKAFGKNCQYLEQKHALGTGQAVQICQKKLQNKFDNVIVCYGDTALTQPETFKKLMTLHNKNKAAITFLTAIFPNPSFYGYGRVIRDKKNKVLAIVEQKLASPKELKIKECNSGAYVFNAAWLWKNINLLKLRPKGEYYLTDLIELAISQGKLVQAMPAKNFIEGLGVNSLENLKEAEKLLTKLKT